MTDDTQDAFTINYNSIDDLLKALKECINYAYSYYVNIKANIMHGTTGEKNAEKIRKTCERLILKKETTELIEYLVRVIDSKEGNWNRDSFKTILFATIHRGFYLYPIDMKENVIEYVHGEMKSRMLINQIKKVHIEILRKIQYKEAKKKFKNFLFEKLELYNFPYANLFLSNVMKNKKIRNEIDKIEELDLENTTHNDIKEFEILKIFLQKCIKLKMIDLSYSDLNYTNTIQTIDIISKIDKIKRFVFFGSKLTSSEEINLLSQCFKKIPEIFLNNCFRFKIELTNNKIVRDLEYIEKNYSPINSKYFRKAREQPYLFFNISELELNNLSEIKKIVTTPELNHKIILYFSFNEHNITDEYFDVFSELCCSANYIEINCCYLTVFQLRCFLEKIKGNKTIEALIINHIPININNISILVAELQGNSSLTYLKLNNTEFEGNMEVIASELKNRTPSHIPKITLTETFIRSESIKKSKYNLLETTTNARGHMAWLKQNNEILLYNKSYNNVSNIKTSNNEITILKFIDNQTLMTAGLDSQIVLYCLNKDDEFEQSEIIPNPYPITCVDLLWGRENYIYFGGISDHIVGYMHDGETLINIQCIAMKESTRINCIRIYDDHLIAGTNDKILIFRKDEVTNIFSMKNIINSKIVANSIERLSSSMILYGGYSSFKNFIYAYDMKTNEIHEVRAAFKINSDDKISNLLNYCGSPIYAEYDKKMNGFKINTIKNFDSKSKLLIKNEYIVSSLVNNNYFTNIKIASLFHHELILNFGGEVCTISHPVNTQEPINITPPNKREKLEVIHNYTDTAKKLTHQGHTMLAESCIKAALFMWHNHNIHCKDSKEQTDDQIFDLLLFNFYLHYRIINYSIASDTQKKHNKYLFNLLVKSHYKKGGIVPGKIDNLEKYLFNPLKKYNNLKKYNEEINLLTTDNLFNYNFDIHFNTIAGRAVAQIISLTKNPAQPVNTEIVKTEKLSYLSMIYFNVITILGRNESRKLLLENLIHYSDKEKILNYNYYIMNPQNQNSCATLIRDMINKNFGQCKNIPCEKLQRFLALSLTDAVINNVLYVMKILFPCFHVILLCGDISSGNPKAIIHAAALVSSMFVILLTSLGNCFNSQTLITLANYINKITNLIKKPIYKAASFMIKNLFIGIESLIFIGIESIFKNFSRLYINFMKYTCSFFVTVAYELIDFLIKPSLVYLRDVEFFKVICKVSEQYTNENLLEFLSRPYEKLNSENFRSELIASTDSQATSQSINNVIRGFYTSTIWFTNDYMNFKKEAYTNEAAKIVKETEDAIKSTQKEISKILDNQNRM